MNLKERLQKEVMIIDGSMGALLQEEGLPRGQSPDLWNLEKPEIIADVHRRYAVAGAQIVITNTFGASAIRLEEYRRRNDLERINRAGVEIARKGSSGAALVAGGMGPLGRLIYPSGEVPFEDAVAIFREQARVLAEGGVDILIIETMFDIMEMKAAIIGCNEVRKGIPLIASMTYNADGITDTGSTPEAATAVMEGLGVDVIGVNCSTGPAEMVPIVRRISGCTSLPIMVEPNAGLPVMENGRMRFRSSMDEIASYAPKFVDAGANIVGGCCGTRPDYIGKISALIRGKRPVTRPQQSGVVLASRARTLWVGAGHPFVKIGEKINPTGKKKFSEAIKEGRTDLILIEARKQDEAGAMALDVNVGVPLIDEAAMITKSIVSLQNVTSLPLVVDSSNNNALSAGLSVYAGRALINSVNAEPSKMEVVVPLAKRMGAAVLALTAGEDVPESSDKRFENAQRILNYALAAGMRREDIIFDCLAVVVSAMQEGAAQTLRTIRRINEELRCATVVGLSNTSFGLPLRSVINSNFLAMAMAEGLDCAIVDPYDGAMHKTVAAASLFIGRDLGCKKFMEEASKWEIPGPPVARKAPTSVLGNGMAENTTAQRIFSAVVEGEKDSISSFVRAGLDEGMRPMDIFLNQLTPAIRKVGDLFAERRKFIPHLVASADTMKKGMEILDPLLRNERGGHAKGTIVFATVKGDVHDIGKNICIIMLENFGYRVIDLGRGVPSEEILKEVEMNNADIVALSALMTTTMVEMPLVIKEIRKRGLPARVMVGGAVVTKSFAEEIGADGYGKDVGEIVTVTERLMARK